jgi:hypothetical protein
MQTIILNDNEVEVDGVKYIKESKPKYEIGKWATIVPDKKKLPKTKTEFIDFLQHWEAGSDNTMREFLNDYED